MKEAETGKRKRGRKVFDAVDLLMKDKRKALIRGIPFVLKEYPDLIANHGSSTVDEITRVVLDRELDLVRKRELVEIREIPDTERGCSSTTIPGSVATRLVIPALSSAKCINTAMSHLQHFQTVQRHDTTSVPFFTPEAYIILSKACELITIELSTRAHVNASLSPCNSLLDTKHLAVAIRSSWKSTERDYSAAGSFDFLIDALDRFKHADVPDPLDVIGKIHRTSQCRMHLRWYRNTRKNF